MEAVFSKRTVVLSGLTSVAPHSVGKRARWRRGCQRYVISLSALLGLVTSHVAADAVNFAEQSIRVALLQEPPSLNSIMTTDLVSFFVLGHTMEGLLRYDRRGRLTGGVAESWQVEPTRLTFTLRATARWRDGRTVTADDFVFAWRRVNDPATASPYAGSMAPIKNATAVQQGRMPPAALGVSAPDARTLVVELERACGYCLELVTLGTFLPVRQDFFESTDGRYGTGAAYLLANGPFEMTEWVHESRLVMRRNPAYWNADAIMLNEINVAYITSDNRTRLNLFRDNQIALARLGAETARDAARGGMRLRTFASGGLSFLWMNMRDGRATADIRLRKAIQAVADPETYVNQVVAIPGYRPTRTLFPAWLRGMAGPFVDEFPPAPVGVDTDEARQLIEAVRTTGLLEKPLVILTVSSPTGSRAAEYFQGLLRQKLGVESKVDQQSFKQYLQKARGGQFDLALSSWYPDFNDLVTFADLLDSGNPNNRGRYVNSEYDRILDILESEVDPGARFSAAAELQRIAIEDAPLLPMAETASAYLVHPKLRGVVRRVLGADPDYTFARVIE